MSRPSLPALVRDRLTGDAAGITSICTAHPLVIEAALRHGNGTGRRVLIEATCNQVNQEGGYTGMTPADFRRFVEAIATRVNFDPARLILGGDHLGPNPWKTLPAEEAMARAKTMIAAYAAAGFSKLHLDTSMGCAGEAAALPDAVTAARAAALAVVAEDAAPKGSLPPVYVIGTEVPVPGGAQHALDHLEVTSPDAVLATVEVHRRAFAAAGAGGAFSRAIGIVVQPGVEFGNAEVIAYRPEAAQALSAGLADLPPFVFEAHSTDYQPDAALAQLVQDGFAILKVGPWLTFALREALYGLDAIAEVLAPAPGGGLRAAMERLMLEKPASWAAYYSGSPDEQRLQRHFSYSDRIRYYWPSQAAQSAVHDLMARLGDRPIPVPLVGQYLGALASAVADGTLPTRPRDLLLAAVTRVLERYERACVAYPVT